MWVIEQQLSFVLSPQRVPQASTDTRVYLILLLCSLDRRCALKCCRGSSSGAHRRRCDCMPYEVLKIRFGSATYSLHS